jgi:predicted HicB family RNase H-like nuclease
MTEEEMKTPKEKEKTAPFQMRIPSGLLEFFKEEANKIDVSLNNYMLFMMIKHRKESEK